MPKTTYLARVSVVSEFIDMIDLVQNNYIYILYSIYKIQLISDK
jgi:hypothetical protein